MKKIYTTLLLVIGLYGNAQLAIVKDVAAAGITPTSDKQVFWQNNKWNNKFYFNIGTTAKLGVTDGTDAGTFLVKDLAVVGVSTLISKIIPAQDFFYIQVDVIDSYSPYTLHNELWRSDGTAAGTFLLKKFDPTISYPLNLGSDITEYCNNSILGNEMFFAGFTTSNGYELWKSDGTVSGTVMVKDMTAGAGSTPMDGFTRLGSEVYFFTGSGQLWRTNGTEAGTVNIPLPAGLTVYVYNTMVAYNGKLIFIGYDAANGMEPWISDGTTAGTHIIANTSPRTDYNYILTGLMFKEVPGGVLFQQLMTSGSNKITLWKTDGTASGTLQLSAIDVIDEQNTVDLGMTQQSIYIYNQSQKTFFKSNYQQGGSSVISQNLAYNQFSNFYNFKNTLWFSSGIAAFGSDAKEPWRCDGFQTVKTFDINPGVAPSTPFGYFEINNDLYFFANNGGGVKLYKFNGDFTFNNSVNNNWSNGSNWNAGTTPLLTEDATIPSGFNINVDANAFANNLNVSSPLNLTTGNLNFRGNLSLNARVTLNANNIILKGENAAILNGNAANYLATNGAGTVNVENLNPTRGQVNLPIGTATNYNPITIENTGTSDTFSVNVQDGISNTSGGAVNTTWNISEAIAGDSNVNVSFTWNQTQENGLFNRNTAAVGHYYNATWNSESSSIVTGTNPYTISATNISSFSPFGVLNQSDLGNTDFRIAQISIYPNPSNGNFTIQVSESFMGSKVVIYNLLGQEIKTFAIEDISQDVNLERGIYMLQIQKENQVKTKKIIIQ
ncbi:T9SS type A sorting domain-containing protein [Flavobacterium sp.]|uniref:T9SS type A sorting domain-containing protein n=1 Tax=Flavobacterium sp. TaxID=239 RepID=UPI0025FFAA72|nr:T9SS type A sorting domain-containing protein [Flavobacterium sp.]